MSNKLTCLCCKEFFPKDHVWIETPKGRFADYEHLQAYVRSKNALKLFRLKAKTQKAKKKTNAAFDKQVRDNDLPKQKTLTQKAFNRLRVLQELAWFDDKGIEPHCISCGLPLGGDQWCNGHFKTVGGFGELRYDPMNSYLQHNRRCNMALSADIEGSKTTLGYKKGLVQRFGQQQGQAILDYCESYHPPKHYRCDELIAMRKQMRLEIKELERKGF